MKMSLFLVVLTMRIIPIGRYGVLFYF